MLAITSNDNTNSVAQKLCRVRLQLVVPFKEVPDIFSYWCLHEDLMDYKALFDDRNWIGSIKMEIC